MIFIGIFFCDVFVNGGFVGVFLDFIFCFFVDVFLFELVDEKFDLILIFWLIGKIKFLFLLFLFVFFWFLLW